MRARAAYGVVLNEDHTVSEDATTKLRYKIRVDRLGGDPANAAVAKGIAVFTPLGITDEHWTCRICEQDLGASTENRRENAKTIETEASERAANYGQRVRKRHDDRPVVVRKHFCPCCATSLATDVVLEGWPHPPQARLGIYDPFPKK